MRRSLTLLSMVVAVASLTLWLATGAARGFTKTSVPVEKTDEVTGLTYREYERRFVAGVDVLGAGLGAAALLFGASRFCGRRRSPGAP